MTGGCSIPWPGPSRLYGQRRAAPNTAHYAHFPAGTGKTRITIRIDDDVLEWFRKQVHEAGGGSYQTMMNRALREHMERETEPLEDTLRRVLREVLPESRSGTRSKPAKKKTRKKRAAK